VKHIEFVVYCIETYKASKNLPGDEAYNLLRETGAVKYIDDCYDALHTFGDDAIVWNIDEYMKIRLSNASQQ
jgi:hypothetical protein